ncbi:cytochrome b/b6 domain-containing protein [Effusibacillus consociatus]|uniref:Cytochrome b/b6 domain-containing protein n=1 Tax=Effusibacillus consociatus TaxID=1117041 RepID=A0ABV9Q1A5_9BACL
MTEKVLKVRFDFISHWIWTILYLLLALSGFAMMGAKFGWMFGYNFTLADFVHRLVGVLFIVLAVLVVIYEIARIVRGSASKGKWFPIGKQGFAGFTLLTTILLILSGFLLWFHANIPYVFGTFAFAVHEFVALLSIASIVWHIYKKRYILQDISQKENKGD